MEYLAGFGQLDGVVRAWDGGRRRREAGGGMFSGGATFRSHIRLGRAHCQDGAQHSFGPNRDADANWGDHDGPSGGGLHSPSRLLQVIHSLTVRLCESIRTLVPFDVLIGLGQLVFGL